MINADVLTFQEFIMHETLPLSKIQETVLEFLKGRDDVVLFGSQAVNAYVFEPRMTQDVDLLALKAKDFAEELRFVLSEKFHIAVRVREIGTQGLRIYQLRNEGNRHLVDVRPIDDLPNTQLIENIQVLSPLELIVSKTISYHAHKGKPKAGTDWRDLAMLLLQFPELKQEVTANLRTKNVSEDVLKTWYEVESEDIQVEDEDEDLIF
jgi:Nucleotidyl transferase AbiEii toxin, Type IV TA system